MDHSKRAAPNSLSPELDAERREVDRELIQLLLRRRETYRREASVRVRAGIPIESPLDLVKESLEDLVREGLQHGLAPTLMESLFTELSKDSVEAFSEHISQLLSASPEAPVLRIARQRAIALEDCLSMLSDVLGGSRVVADDREVADLRAVFELLRANAVSYGVAVVNLERFEDLAELAQALAESSLRWCVRTPLSVPFDSATGGLEIPGSSVFSGDTAFVIGRELPSQGSYRERGSCWRSWIFLRVPEGRSVRSTDMLIKALMVARRHRVDTSHIHSLPGLSYQGFSYTSKVRPEDSSSHSLEAETNETQRIFPHSGSRSFLIDSRRSPPPDRLEQLVSELVSMGCYAQLVGCMPVLPEHAEAILPENPIRRHTATLRE